MIKYQHRHHQEYLLHGVSLLASGADQRPSLQILATSTKGKAIDDCLQLVGLWWGLFKHVMALVLMMVVMVSLI